MPRNHPSERTINCERKILRALCSGEMKSAVWNRLAASLSAYSWQVPDHRVVYDALRGIRSRDAATRRDQLPAQVTRMGFPDLNCSVYFAPTEISEREIEGLVRQLKAELS